MEKSKKPALRRLETTTMDVKKMPSSLNISSSSLRSSSELDSREISSSSTGRRPATVRFAPTPTTLSSSSSSLSSAATRRGGSSSRVVSPSPSSRQAGVGAARPATARPASVSGPRARTSAWRSLQHLPGGSPELGPKGLWRSWGWGTASGGDVEENEKSDHRWPGDTNAVGEVKSQVRSSSVPRRTPTDQEKQQQKRESKTKITSKTMASSVSPPKAADVSMERRSPSTAANRKAAEKAPSSASLQNSMVRASPPLRKTTPATIGASWESLPPDLQSIGLEVMSYRDAAEVAAVEALQEASSAEILLRCLSAFADLAAVAAEQSPQQTVDELLALQATLARSTAAALGARHADDWLRAAVIADLGHFSLYSRRPSPPSP